MTEKFIIRGGRPLSGEAWIHGSKNAASKMMIASLLTDEPCVLENIPFSAEIDITSELCEKVGSALAFDASRHLCRIETKRVTTSQIPELSRRNRIPILALGPLLHRNGRAEVPVLGGCPIGHRPINFHFEALTKMGVRIERKEHSYVAEAHDIHGADIHLPYPSVGATENVLLTSVLARGKTVISNAAVEPEIANLIEMLSSMGARITCNSASRSIEVDGVSRLKGISSRIMPDRNEAVSFASAVLATEGEVLVHGVAEEHLSAFLSALTSIGALFKPEKDGIRFFGKKPYRAITIETSPHPGFMTDWQQPFCVALTQAEGISRIHETVYEDRFGYAKDLARMGASIELSDECLAGTPCRFSGFTFNHSLSIRGPSYLMGTSITMTDVRAGMAHIIAALAARGESLITGIEHIDRGYEDIDGRLRGLGADIRRVSSQ